MKNKNSLSETEILRGDLEIFSSYISFTSSDYWISFFHRNREMLKDNMGIYLLNLKRFFPALIIDNIFFDTIKNYEFFSEEIQKYIEIQNMSNMFKRENPIWNPVKNFQDTIQNIHFKVYTLSLVISNEKLLLGKKKRGFGKGYYNGFGGKVEKNEKIQEAAIRELYEECGVIAKRSQLIGKLYFRFSDLNISPIEGYVYKISKFTGIPQETEEMIPVWFSIPETISANNMELLYCCIPFSYMWEDDVFWFPYFLKGNSFFAFFDMDNQQKIQSMKMIVLDSTLDMDISKIKFLDG